MSKRSFISKAWWIVLVLIMTLSLSACAGSAAPAADTSSDDGGSDSGEKVLIVASPENIDTFDPCCTVGTKNSQTAIQNVFDQLTQYAQVEKTLPNGETYMTVDTSNIVGMLAESWEQDGDVVTFKLREGLTFANGDPVTAQAIVDGYERIFEVGGLSFFLLTMGSVNDASAFEVVDDLTLTMSMETANNLVNLNNVMHNTSAVSPAEMAEHATDSDPWATEYFRQNLPTGSGPFMLEEYVPDDRVVLTARDDYYAGRANLDKVIVKIVADPAQRVLLLKQGEVDLITIIPIKDLDDLEADPNIKVLSIPSTNNEMLQLNNAIAPFDNKMVRKAVAYAVPYDTIIQEVWKGRAQRLKSPIADGTPTSDFSTWAYDTDLDKAAELLAEAGFPGGEGLPAIKLSVRIGNEEQERMAVFIQDALSQIGMNVEIEKLAHATFQELEQKRELQMFMDNWISWVNDPFYHLSWIYSSTSPLVYTNYNNQEVTDLITKYTLWAGDEEERNDASRQIQEMIIDDSPIIYLAAPNWNVAMRSNISGYVYYNDELNRYYYMDKE
ncbi:MAG: ABC transporter substrate-binding protein [Chloroflexota bacterium]